MLGRRVHPTCFVHAVDDDNLIDIRQGVDAQWITISTHRSCAVNDENIKHYHDQSTATLDSCKLLCLSDLTCRAIDWYDKTKWCNLYKKPCKHPRKAKHKPSSYYICRQAGSGDGMMGILGNRRKYVCNAVQTVLAHLLDTFNMTFRASLVSKANHRFWYQGNGTTSKRHVLEIRPKIRRNDDGEKEHPTSEIVFSRPHNASVNGARQGSNKSQRYAESVNNYTAKNYTIPPDARPGNRCASAKRDLGDDLLTVVALVPVRIREFKRRSLLRKYLSTAAHKVRSRQHYRKIQTSSKPKRHWLFDRHNYSAWIHPFTGIKHAQYTTYKWGWFQNLLASPVDDPRAVCVEVLFAVSDTEFPPTPSVPSLLFYMRDDFHTCICQVGMTKTPWASGEIKKWGKLSKEAHKYNDIIIGPYLDGRLVEHLIFLSRLSLCGHCDSSIRLSGERGKP